MKSELMASEFRCIRLFWGFYVVNCNQSVASASKHRFDPVNSLRKICCQRLADFSSRLRFRFRFQQHFDLHQYFSDFDSVISVRRQRYRRPVLPLCVYCVLQSLRVSNWEPARTSLSTERARYQSPKLRHFSSKSWFCSFSFTQKWKGSLHINIRNHLNIIALQNRRRYLIFCVSVPNCRASINTTPFKPPKTALQISVDPLKDA